LIGRERFGSPIIENEQFDARQGAQEPGVARVAVRDGEIGEQPGNAGVENGDVFSARLVAERAGEPTLAQPAGAGYEQIAALGDPVAGGELEEQGAIEPARALIVDVLDAGGMTQASDPGAGLEPLLSAQRQLVFEQQTEPFRVIEAAHFGFVFEFLESLGHAGETEGVQLFDCGVSEHEDFLSMVVAGAAQIGVIEERRGTAVLGRRIVVLAGEKGGDAFAIEDAEFDGARRHRFEAGHVDAAIRTQNAQASAEPLFGVRPAGEHGADQPFGVRPDLAGPTAEPIRRPLGVAPVGTGHVVGVRAVLAAHVTALMDADALAAMEDLDRACGDAHVDLGADQRVRTEYRKPWTSM